MNTAWITLVTSNNDSTEAMAVPGGALVRTRLYENVAITFVPGVTVQPTPEGAGCLVAPAATKPSPRKKR